MKRLEGFQKEWMFLERYAAWISNIKAGKSHRALKRVLILISVKFMYKIVAFEEFLISSEVLPFKIFLKPCFYIPRTSTLSIRL